MRRFMSIAGGGRGLATVAGAISLAIPLTTPALSSAEVSPRTIDPASVSGPVANTPSDYAFLIDGFGAAPPRPRGVSEAEYFASGTASIYESSGDGIEVVAPCPGSVDAPEPGACTDLPYTTRMIVKYPSNPRRFSGTVIVNPLNPSGYIDEAVIWDLASDYVRRRGDIYVGFTSKGVTVAALKDFNSTRYADLHWPYTPASPGSNSSTYDGITHDVAAQIATYFKLNRRRDALKRYKVKRVIEAGYSQDGNFVFTQAALFSKLNRLADGEPVFDGYLPAAMTSQSPGTLNFGLTPDDVQPADEALPPHRGPVIQVNTQFELSSAGGRPVLWRRPDSNEPGDRYRGWELAGPSHDTLGIDATLNIGTIPVYGAPYLNGVEQEQLGLIGAGLIGANGQLDAELNPAIAPCDRLDVNPYPTAFNINAALAGLTKWISRGDPPPRARRLKVANPTTNPTPALDEHGNARRGVRTPYVDVPDRTYQVFGSGAPFCVIEGHSDPFSPELLEKLYGSTDRYRREFKASAEKAVKRGLWLKRDARSAVRQARAISVP